MSGLSSPSLIIAGLELGLVRMLRGAMASADCGAAAGPGGSGCGPVGGRPAAVYEPTPRFEPRKVYHPTPRFEPRPVIRPEPRIETGPPRSLPPCPPPCEPEKPRVCPPPVLPVWQTLPPVNIPHGLTADAVKVQVVRPDIRHKGTLIDTFI